MRIDVHELPAHECVDRAAWRDLAVTADATPPQFLPGWQEAWWRHRARPGTRPVTIAAYRGESLVGLLPLALVRRRRVLRLARIAGLDWGWGHGVLAVRDDCVEIAQALLRSSAGTGYDVLRLDGLQAGSAVGAATRLHTVPLTPVPLVDFAGTWEETFLRLMSKRTRKKLTSKWRRFRREHDVTVTVHRDDLAIRAVFPDYVRVHRARWASLQAARGVRDVSPLATDHGAEFAREALCGLAVDGVGRLLVIEAEGSPVAFREFAVVDDFVHGYRNEFDPSFARYSLGVLAIASAFDDAIAGGARLGSLGNGNDAYKDHLTTRKEPVLRGFVAGDTLLGGAGTTALTGGHRLRGAVRDSIDGHPRMERAVRRVRARA